MKQGASWIRWSLLCLTLMGVVAAAAFWQWTARLDLSVQDAAQRAWARGAPADIVIVAIDDASLAAIGRWPWKRAVHAQAIHRIDEAGAKSILLNLLLSEPEGDPHQDEVLAAAMQASGKVVTLVGRMAGDGSLPQGAAALLPPAAPIAHAAHLAHAEVQLDADGSVRRMRPWSGHGASALPHPALALLKAAHQMPTSLEDELGMPHDHRLVAVPFATPPGGIAQVSYAALLRGEVPPARLRDRHVLIGVTAQGLGETFQTPMSTDGQGMSGVEIVGQRLAALSQGRLIRETPPAWHATVCAGLLLTLMLAYTRLSPRQGLMLAGAAILAALALSWALMSMDLWWPPGALVLGVLLSYPLWSWHKLEATARDLEAELERLSGDPSVLTDWPASRSTSAAASDFMGQRTAAISHAGAQVRHARQVLARTLAALPDAVFVADGQHRITQTNDAACRLVGAADAAALLGRPLDEVLSPWTPHDAPSWLLILARTRHDNEVRHTEAAHPDGKRLLMSLARVEAETGVSEDAELIVCATDVTSLREAELQRAELLGFIAHDIRSPQASLVSLVELHRIGGRMSHEETLAHVESMAKQSLQLCEELLQVMRAETRPVSLSAGDLVDLAQGCIREMQLQAHARAVTVAADWPEGLRMPAVFDDYLLHRALTNLLSNAIKFSPTQGRVSVSLHRQAGHDVLAVRDQGPGIPESELGRLFKRYERVEQGRPSKLAAGIGLGLVFIDTVARRHGGHVKVINRPGEGACFEMWLPALGLDQPHAAATQTAPTGT
ncbi:MAG: CHASE2 domain-containing protein [Aquabacterium sp.]